MGWSSFLIFGLVLSPRASVSSYIETKTGLCRLLCSRHRKGVQQQQHSIAVPRQTPRLWHLPQQLDQHLPRLHPSHSLCCPWSSGSTAPQSRFCSRRVVLHGELHEMQVTRYC